MKRLHIEGTAKVIDFDAGDGSLVVGEEVTVLKDDGSGWVFRVTRRWVDGGVEHYAAEPLRPAPVTGVA